MNLPRHIGHSVTIDRSGTGNAATAVLNCQTCGIAIGWQFVNTPAPGTEASTAEIPSAQVGLSDRTDRTRRSARE